jgi:DNA-binding transcriptional MocR family regulator
MHIPLDRQQDIPLYLQIEEALRRAILSGVFADGDKLPSTRTLAAELSVSRLTVDNAYAELAAKGLLQQRRGSGAYVAIRIHGYMVSSRWTVLPLSPHGWTGMPISPYRQIPSILPLASVAPKFSHWMNSARSCIQFCAAMLKKHSVTAITAAIIHCAIHSAAFYPHKVFLPGQSNC